MRLLRNRLNSRDRHTTPASGLGTSSPSVSSRLPSRKTKFRRSGQALVEFALIVPVLLLLLLGTVEVGWLLNINLQFANAAREGARAAALGKTSAVITTRVTNYLAAVRITPTITTEFSNNDGTSWTVVGTSGAYNNAQNGSLIRVSVTATHRQLTNFIPGLNNFVISKSVIMRREPT